MLLRTCASCLAIAALAGLPQVHADDVEDGISMDAPPVTGPPVAGPPVQPVFRGGAARTSRGLYRVQIGNYTGDTVGNNNDFLSLDAFGGLFTTDRMGLLFGDSRLILNDYQNVGTNLGLGYRQYIADIDAIFGANLFYDHRDTGRTEFSQVGAGLELIGPMCEWRSNLYFPVDRREELVGVDHVGILLGQNVFQTGTYEASFRGADTEVGVLLVDVGGISTKALVGGYHFQAPAFSKVWGWKARVEAGVSENLLVNLGVNQDGLFDTTVMLGVELAWPSLNGTTNRTRTGTVLDSLGDPVRRQQNIIVAERTGLVDTGAQVFFVDATGGGSGLRSAPQTLAGASGDPQFGANDVIVLLNQNGTINGDITLDQPGQRLIGSADGSGNAVVTLFDGTVLSLTGLGGRPTLDGTLQMNNSSVASGFDIDTLGWNGIMSTLAAGQTAVVSDVNILNAGDDGLQLDSMEGTFSFLAGTTGGVIANARGDGIQIADSGGTVNLDGVTIQDPAVSGIRADNFSGDLEATGQTTIDGASGGASILVVDSTGNLTFDGLDITDGPAGISLSNADGSFTVRGDTRLTSTGDHGVIVANGSDADVTFGRNLIIDDTFSAGVSLNGGAGDFTVGGMTMITDPGDQGIVALNTSGDLSFNSISIDGSGEAGISLNTHTGDFTATGMTTLTDTGDFGLRALNGSPTMSFAGLDISDTGVAGISLRDADGSFSSNAPIITDNTGDQGLLVVNYTGDINYTSLTSTNVNLNGLSFSNYSGDLTATGATSVTGGQQGLLINASSGNFTFASVNVTNPAASGIALADVSGSFTSSGGTVSGINSFNNGFSMLSGTADISLTDMIFSTTNNDVFGLVSLQFTNGGSAALNNVQANFAAASTGTIGFRTGNAGGTAVELSGTGNTTSNAVAPTQDDGGLFNGSFEVDGNPFTP